MPSGLIIKTGNYGFPLTFTVVNADGTAYDLTGVTVKLRVWTTELVPTQILSGACTNIAPYTAGICAYTVTATDFTKVGQYYADLLLTKTGYDEETETITLNVIPASP